MSQGWRHYPHARLVDMHDGDTCEVLVDHGFSLFHHVAIRLFGISCPELTGAEKPMGQDALRVARAITWNSCALEDCDVSGVRCELWTWKASFSRYVGRVVLASGVDVARAVVEAGYGHAWDGKTERRKFDPAAFPLALAAHDEAAMYDGLIERDFRP